MAIFKKEKLGAQPSNEFQHTVLLVDDEPDNLSVLSSILGNRYHIMQASDGQEALEMVQSMANPARLSLVVSDQRMPRLTGVELCEKLCVLSPNTVRIIVTGYIDVDAIVDSINRARIYRFVIKPFDRHDFELTVQRSIEAFEMKLKLDDYVANLESKVEQRTLELQQRNDQLQAAHTQLEQLSTTDVLTGLNNRRYLLDVIEKDVVIALRSHQSPLKLGNVGDELANDADLLFFLIDCDHFKQVNDLYGHDVGDQVLCAISKVLREVFRPSDHVVRWGGEEFLVIARFVSRGQAAELAERTRAALADMAVVLSDGAILKRTSSIGFAALPFVPIAAEAFDWQQVLKLADCALYCAKHSGRNTWVGLSAGTNANGTEPVQHNRDIPAQLERGLLSAQAPQPLDQLRWL